MNTFPFVSRQFPLEFHGKKKSNSSRKRVTKEISNNMKIKCNKKQRVHLFGEYALATSQMYNFIFANIFAISNSKATYCARVFDFFTKCELFAYQQAFRLVGSLHSPIPITKDEFFDFYKS